MRNNGGLLHGPSHAEGGIKAVVQPEGRPIEMEGGEVVINKRSVASTKRYKFNGQSMTPRQILSKINEDGGGVKFAEGGPVGHAMKGSGKRYTWNDEEVSDYVLLNKFREGGELYGEEAPDTATLAPLVNMALGKRSSHQSARLLHTILEAHEIPHMVYVGTVQLHKHKHPFHYWIELPDDRIIDLTADHWIEGAQTGILKDPPQQYKGKEVDMPALEHHEYLREMGQEAPVSHFAEGGQVPLSTVDPNIARQVEFVQMLCRDIKSVDQRLDRLRMEGYEVKEFPHVGKEKAGGGGVGFFFTDPYRVQVKGSEKRERKFYDLCAVLDINRGKSTPTPKMSTMRFKTLQELENTPGVTPFGFSLNKEGEKNYWVKSMNFLAGTPLTQDELIEVQRKNKITRVDPEGVIIAYNIDPWMLHVNTDKWRFKLKEELLQLPEAEEKRAELYWKKDGKEVTFPISLWQRILGKEVKSSTVPGILANPGETFTLVGFNPAEFIIDSLSVVPLYPEYLTQEPLPERETFRWKTKEELLATLPAAKEDAEGDIHWEKNNQAQLFPFYSARWYQMTGKQTTPESVIEVASFPGESFSVKEENGQYIIQKDSNGTYGLWAEYFTYEPLPKSGPTPTPTPRPTPTPSPSPNKWRFKTWEEMLQLPEIIVKGETIEIPRTYNGKKLRNYITKRVWEELQGQEVPKALLSRNLGDKRINVVKLGIKSKYAKILMPVWPELFTQDPLDEPKPEGKLRLKTWEELVNTNSTNWRAGTIGVLFDKSTGLAETLRYKNYKPFAGKEILAEYVEIVKEIKNVRYVYYSQITGGDTQKKLLPFAPDFLTYDPLPTPAPTKQWRVKTWDEMLATLPIAVIDRSGDIQWEKGWWTKNKRPLEGQTISDENYQKILAKPGIAIEDKTLGFTGARDSESEFWYPEYFTPVESTPRPAPTKQWRVKTWDEMLATLPNADLDSMGDIRWSIKKPQNYWLTAKRPYEGQIITDAIYQKIVNEPGIFLESEALGLTYPDRDDFGAYWYPEYFTPVEVEAQPAPKIPVPVLTSEEAAEKLLAAYNNELLRQRLVLAAVDFRYDREKYEEVIGKINDLTRRIDELKVESLTPEQLMDKIMLSYTQPFYTGVQEQCGNTDTPTGAPSELRADEYEAVRTQHFKDWFGDWEDAYARQDYAGCSKVINPRTGEPLITFRGATGDYRKWSFTKDRLIGYFAEDPRYSKYFAIAGDPANSNVPIEDIGNGGEGGMIYRCFLNIREPLDLTDFGIDRIVLKRLLDFIRFRYGLTSEGIDQMLPPGYEVMMDKEVQVWNIVRANPLFAKYLSKRSIFDGIIQVEDNPDDHSPEWNGAQAVTKAFVVFSPNQQRATNAVLFSTMRNDMRFEKGGVVRKKERHYTIDSLFARGGAIKGSYKKGDEVIVNGVKYYVDGLPEEMLKKLKGRDIGEQEFYLANNNVNIVNSKYFTEELDVAAESRSWFKDKEQPTENQVRAALIWGYDQYGDYQIKAGGGSASDSVYVSSFKSTIADPSGNDKDVVILKKYSKNFKDVLITIAEIQALQDATETPQVRKVREKDNLRGTLSYLMRYEAGYEKVSAQGEKTIQQVYRQLANQEDGATSEEINKYFQDVIKNAQEDIETKYIGDNPQKIQERKDRLQKKKANIEKIKNKINAAKHDPIADLNELLA